MSLVTFVETFSEFDNTVTGIFEQTATIGVGRQDGAVTWQGQPQCFGETVHRVGGEYPEQLPQVGRTALDFGQGFVIDTVVGRHDHCIDEVEAVIQEFGLTGFHRAADTKITGILRRIAAISIPGVILSQLEMHTSASAQWALHMYSTLSAMISRLGSE